MDPSQEHTENTKMDGCELADMDRCTVDSNNSAKRHEGDGEKITLVFLLKDVKCACWLQGRSAGDERIKCERQ